MWLSKIGLLEIEQDTPSSNLVFSVSQTKKDPLSHWVALWICTEQQKYERIAANYLRMGVSRNVGFIANNGT